MSYLYNETNSLGGTGGQFSGKNKAVLLTNLSGVAGATVDLYTYRPNGTTAATRVVLAANQTTIFEIRTWGVSCGSGITGAVLS